MKKVIICGAGIGGLVSAVYLFHKGFEVEIFEKNLRPGGKMNEFKKDGYRFDTGPSLISLPEIFNNFFRDIDKNLNDYFELIALESSCKYFWSDGTVFNSFTNEAKLSKELTEVFGEKEKDNFFRFLKYGKLFYDLSKDNFLMNEFKIKNFITKEGLRNITKFISGRSLNDVSNKFFKNKKLKQLMDRFATYNGSSPFLAPQLFSIIPYTEYTFGAWYIKGGIYEIARSLERVCKENNITINYGAELSGFKSENKNITELSFKNSRNEHTRSDKFDHLICNFTSNRELTGEDYLPNDDWSCSGFIMLIGINREFKELSHHNILFADENENEFLSIFENKVPADDMTVYISISKKNESSDAPDGCENWFVLVNAPSISDKFEWTEENKSSYKNKVLDRINSFPFMKNVSIKDHIEFCEIYTPLDIRDNYNSEFGSIYGLSSNSLYTLMRRPKNKSKKFDNLYFVGGNTHPGGGVPLCFLSGKIVSGLVR